MKNILLLTLFMLDVSLATKTGLDFLVLGDWGGSPKWPYTTDIEEHTSKQMAITAAKTSSSFVVALGDNFYESGVKNDQDPRFEETYSGVFKQPSLQIPWYVIGGNHDHRGNITAQITYSRRSPHWKFPYYWHAQKMIVPGTNRTLKLVLLDTVLLCGNTGIDSDLDQPKGPENSILAETQWSWLEEQLKYSKDDFLIVGGHFPVWSIAEHGPTHCLVDRLRPLLEHYKVNSYICGHDHNLQHIHEDKSDVNYFVVGSADKIDPSTEHRLDVPNNSSKFYWADYDRKGGFAHVRVSESRMVFTLIDSLGAVLHQANMKPRFG